MPRPSKSITPRSKEERQRRRRGDQLAASALPLSCLFPSFSYPWLVLRYHASKSSWTRMSGKPSKETLSYRKLSHALT
ncbi:hypothetical protein CC80DRAFT_15220 [Byssothecium circinans]|uniref:Uncharacterized protein n=1 Tax=Byssothecium circinans TaxID=147558 RepID=A0A6A5U6J5_9PLEO|nr:hypothetical protein CC80DRAFT_15220 [Byssothecium circinans]